MKAKNLISTLLCSLFVFAGQQAYANTYFLNQSNTLADGVNYAQVDVLENGGNLDFLVTALSPTNWRFSTFYFNLGGDTGAVSLTGLPTGWSADTDRNVSTFGLFSDGARGTGSSLQSIFSFTADGVNPLSFASLIANIDGWTFAGHVQCSGRGGNVCDEVGGESSHFVAGVSPIPVPGAIWLFGTALLGFVSMSNRRKV
jgi:hypothetical protein